MKFRIGSRIFAGLLTMFILLLAGGVVTILYTYHLHRVTSEMLDENVANLKAAQELEVILFRMRGLAFNYLLDDDPRWLEKFETEQHEFRSWLEAARQVTRSQEENEILNDIDSLFTNYEQEQQAGLSLHRNGQSVEAHAKLLHMSRDGFDTLYEQCEAYVAANENALFAAQAQIERVNGIVRLTMYGLGLGGVMLGSILGWVVSQSIVKPIYELVLKVRGATGNELVERMAVKRGAELEDLDRQVHALIDRINTTTADLARHRRLLWRAEKLAALGKVAAGVAHEIRNPLTAIKMLIYSLREDLVTNDETREDLAVIMKEIERMERFIQNFLEFARPPDPALAPIDLNATVRETLTLLAPRLRQSRTEVVERYQHDLGRLLADADQIKQVMMNLVLNAVEAMPSGGRLTIVTTRNATLAGGNGKAWVQIRLTDTGRGIPAEILDNLFDPFVTRRKDGTGLGLSVAHQIIDRHGGYIEVANNPEGGATFVVSLPAA